MCENGVTIKGADARAWRSVTAAVLDAVHVAMSTCDDNSGPDSKSCSASLIQQQTQIAHVTSGGGTVHCDNIQIGVSGGRTDVHACCALDTVARAIVSALNGLTDAQAPSAVKRCFLSTLVGSTAAEGINVTKLKDATYVANHVIPILQNAMSFTCGQGSKGGSGGILQYKDFRNIVLAAGGDVSCDTLKLATSDASFTLACTAAQVAAAQGKAVPGSIAPVSSLEVRAEDLWQEARPWLIGLLIFLAVAGLAWLFMRARGPDIRDLVPTSPE